MPTARVFWRMAAMEQFLEGPLLADSGNLRLPERYWEFGKHLGNNPEKAAKWVSPG
jgi:hypothetical protein